jgi:biotin carboxyl carrier protein
MVSVGQAVEVGQPLLALEAMKMENEIRAPRSGIVSTLHVAPGQAVGRNEVLAEIT